MTQAEFSNGRLIEGLISSVFRPLSDRCLASSGRFVSRDPAHDLVVRLKDFSHRGPRADDCFHEVRLARVVVTTPATTVSVCVPDSRLPLATGNTSPHRG